MSRLGLGSAILVPQSVVRLCNRLREMTADPHQLRPDHLPTPFSAEEIRVGCPPGRTVRSLVIQPRSEPYVHVTRFVAGDAEGAEQES